MTQRKVVLTSAGAVAARPQYVSSRALVGEQNKTVLAQPVRPTERSEVGNVVPVASRMRTQREHRDDEGIPGRRDAQGAAAHAAACADTTHARTKGGKARIRARAYRQAEHQHDAYLAGLSKEQRQDLLDLLALENVQGVGGRELDMWSAAVATALEDAIGASGGAAYGQMLCKRQLGSSSTWKPIEAFMRTSGLIDLVVVERQAVYNLLARLIVDAAGYSARRSGAPLSLKLTASHTGQVNGIFERAFPGYLAAGLAYVVAKQSLRS